MNMGMAIYKPKPSTSPRMDPSLDPRLFRRNQLCHHFDFDLQNCETIHFRCLSHSVCGALLWHPSKLIQVQTSETPLLNIESEKDIRFWFEANGGKTDLEATAPPPRKITKIRPQVAPLEIASAQDTDPINCIANSEPGPLPLLPQGIWYLCYCPHKNGFHTSTCFFTLLNYKSKSWIVASDLEHKPHCSALDAKRNMRKWASDLQTGRMKPQGRSSIVEGTRQL